MRLRALKTFAGPHGTAAAGEIVEIADVIAKSLIEVNAAAAMSSSRAISEAKKEGPISIEAATAPAAVEKAVSRDRGKPRR